MNPSKRRKFGVLDALILVASTAVSIAWCVTVERQFEKDDAAIMRLFQAEAKVATEPVSPKLPEDADDLVSPTAGDARPPTHIPQAEAVTPPVSRPPNDAPTAEATPHGARQWLRAAWTRLTGNLALDGAMSFRYLSLFLAVWTIAYSLLRVRSPRPAFRRLLRSPGTSAGVAVLLVLIIQFSIWLLKWLAFVCTGMDVKWLGTSWDVMKEVCGVAGPAILASWLILALGRGCRLRWDWVERIGVVLALGWIVLLLEPVLLPLLHTINQKFGNMP
jgi:hypothetical protein